MTIASWPSPLTGWQHSQEPAQKPSHVYFLGGRKLSLRQKNAFKTEQMSTCVNHQKICLLFLFALDIKLNIALSELNINIALNIYYILKIKYCVLFLGVGLWRLQHNQPSMCQLCVVVYYVAGDLLEPIGIRAKGKGHAGVQVGAVVWRAARHGESWCPMTGRERNEEEGTT